MADSEEIKTQEASKPPESKKETSLVIIPTKEGGTREMLRTPGGTFAKKPKPLIPTVDFVRARRKRLISTRKDNGLTEDQSIVNELLAIINAPVATDAKSGLPDAKHMMAKIKAAEVLWLFSTGKPDPSEREMDKLTVQPFKVVFMPAIPLMNPEVQEEARESTKTQPSFAEAVVIQQN
jgi:hypothetical protein